VIDPTQIVDDLRGLFRGRLHFDSASRSLYSTDASPFEVMPHGVAIPADADDLKTLITYASDNALPLVARGAGTGLSGESLGPGLIVDLSVNFRKIRDITPGRVVVEAGVTLAELNEALAPLNQRFAPDPASWATCTLGGMLATNASGGNALKHGYTRDYVLGMTAFWDDGSPAQLIAPNADLPRPTEVLPRTVEIRSQLAALLAENRDLVQLTRPLTRYNRCGYVLHDVLTSQGLDLSKLLTGSEGTLAFITEATLKTVPLPGGVCQAVLGFANSEAAIKAGQLLRSTDGIVSCDMLDQRVLAISRTLPLDQGIGPIPVGVGAALVFMLECDSRKQAETAAREALQRIQERIPVAVLIEPTTDTEHLQRIQEFRRATVGGLYSLGLGARPVACVEDVAVPSEELPRFLAEVRSLFQRQQLSASILVHVLAGQVHTRPLIDLNNPVDRVKLWPLAEAIHQLAIALGGTVSTQHGTGITRTPWVEKQYGPLMPVFRELKRIFDPKNIFNPGKIIGPDPSRPAWPLRGTTVSQPASARQPLLVWSEPTPLDVSRSCNGCGDCRTRSSGRMCPVFRANGEEAATPRAKANLLRGILEQADAGQLITQEQVRNVTDLCVNCKMCRDECRGEVNIPKLMLEAKAAHFAEHGLDRADWAMARIESLVELAGFFPMLANFMLGSRPSRWILEQFFGLSRKRTLPRVVRWGFLRRAQMLGLTTRPVSDSGSPRNAVYPGPDELTFRDQEDIPRKVAYFSDHFTNRHDFRIGLATVAVLKHQGIEVHVPWRQKTSGMSSLTQGDFETAREIATYNLRTLADLVRDGYTIVCSEPTAALAITQDYLDLVDEPDARLVAANTVELMTLLSQLHRIGEFKTDFQNLDITIGHHVPCHMKALNGPIAGPKLLELIPGLKVRTIDKSCSGMAGTFGLRADQYETSLLAGKPMLDELNRPGVLFGSTECSACRMQMQESTGKRTWHPIQYLALAYGLMPELAERLARPLRKRLSD
jgi:FAD/FMN-containing dehydrogenase/Fe-S oxidoreductase